MTTSRPGSRGQGMGDGVPEVRAHGARSAHLRDVAIPDPSCREASSPPPERGDRRPLPAPLRELRRARTRPPSLPSGAVRERVAGSTLADWRRSRSAPNGAGRTPWAERHRPEACSSEALGYYPRRPRCVNLRHFVPQNPAGSGGDLRRRRGTARSNCPARRTATGSGEGHLARRSGGAGEAAWVSAANTAERRRACCAGPGRAPAPPSPVARDAARPLPRAGGAWR